MTDADEARAYLAHPILGPQFSESVRNDRAQAEAGIPLRTPMGSPIDSSKLVSCLTLFAKVGRGEPRAEALVADAEAVLTIAATQGLRRCAFTERS